MVNFYDTKPRAYAERNIKLETNFERVKVLHLNTLVSYEKQRSIILSHDELTLMIDMCEKYYW